MTCTGIVQDKDITQSSTPFTYAIPTIGEASPKPVNIGDTRLRGYDKGRNSNSPMGSLPDLIG